MSIWIHEESKVLVQGITGSQGTFHATRMEEYGTDVVGGVTPGKGGQQFQDSVPVFDTVQEAVDKEGADDAAVEAMRLMLSSVSMDGTVIMGTMNDAAKGGDLGTFKRGAMVPEFDSTVFSEETQLGSMSCV